MECVCGARGVVLKGDEPEDGIVQCPGLPGKPCERSYCIKCGAHAHPGKPCEDVDEDEDVLKALGSDTKRCPACGNGITKVGGCNHVLCAPPGGCGKSFCFICLQPHESHDPAKCHGGQQAHDLRHALELQRPMELLQDGRVYHRGRFGALLRWRCCSVVLQLRLVVRVVWGEQHHHRAVRVGHHHLLVVLLARHAGFHVHLLILLRRHAENRWPVTRSTRGRADAAYK